MKKKWHPLEHKVYRDLKPELVALRGKKIYVSVSGGADSVCLLQVLAALASAGSFQLKILHLHHGGRSQFRKSAQNFVKELAARLKLELLLFRHQGAILKSEEDLRDFRTEIFNKVLKSDPGSFLALGHHKDDLLETRLLRLIRGTGRLGLKSMQLRKGSVLRPLLDLSRQDILSYLADTKFSFVEDPSNQDQRYLRNWLRNHWLIDLEKRSPGSLGSLARSLENLSGPSSGLAKKFSKSRISRPAFEALSAQEKQQVLAQYLFRHKGHNYRHSQVKELLKRLDKDRIEHRFVLAGLVWEVNAEQISALNKVK